MTATVINERTERVKLDRLELHPQNPRIGNVDAVLESIETNGFYGTIVAQKATGRILVGNHRYQAARLAGLERVPVVWVDVDDDTALRILLADNRTSDLAEYDDTRLREALEEIMESHGSLVGTGYDDTFLEDLLGQDPDDVPEDPAPDPPAKPTTKLGDLWQLGPHRLLCGDATDKLYLAALLGKAKVDALLTDPPYNVDYRPSGHAEGIANDNQTDDDFLGFLGDAFDRAADALKPGGAAYVFHADGSGNAFRTAFAESGLELKQVLIWVKNSFVLGRQDYQWQHEPILYGWKPGAAHSWYGKFDKTTVIDDAGDLSKLSKDEAIERLEQIYQASTVIREDKPARNSEHPTMKPVKLCARLLFNSTRKGESVLDPFAGSGSTLMAAEHLGRVARCVELDPRYCDVIVQRWEEASGGKARREKR